MPSSQWVAAAERSTALVTIGSITSRGMIRILLLGSLVLPAPPANRNVPQSSSLGPVPPAVLAEMARLGEAIVVVVAELGVERIAAGTLEYLVRLRLDTQSSRWVANSTLLIRTRL